MSLADDKQRIRQETVNKILAMKREQRDVEEIELAEKLVTLPGFEGASKILLFASYFAEEIRTEPFFKKVINCGKLLICPRVDRRTRSLQLFEVKDFAKDLRPGTMGIPEPMAECRQIDPLEVDWVLVPGLAFDGKCSRLGRGAGYYDRLLPTLRHEAMRWSLILEAQWVDEVPMEPHDVPLDGIASCSRTAIRRR